MKDNLVLNTEVGDCEVLSCSESLRWCDRPDEPGGVEMISSFTDVELIGGLIDIGCEEIAAVHTASEVEDSDSMVSKAGKRMAFVREGLIERDIIGQLATGGGEVKLAGHGLTRVVWHVVLSLHRVRGG